MKELSTVEETLDKLLADVISTWPGLLPRIEDSPVAICDYRGADKDDLIACDRVIPTRAGEVYYLRYDLQQRW